MTLLKWLAAGLLWIVAGVLGLVGALLCVTIILLPLGIPLLALTKRLLGLASRLVLPRAVTNPKAALEDIGQSVADKGRGLGKGAGKKAKGAVREVEKKTGRRNRLGLRTP